MFSYQLGCNLQGPQDGLNSKSGRMFLVGRELTRYRVDQISPRSFVYLKIELKEVTKIEEIRVIIYLSSLCSF